MSAIVEGVKQALGRNVDAKSKVEGLGRAVTAARGRLDDDLIAEAQQVVDLAGERLTLSAEHTVVALAGATGSGKSSLFNVLSGLDLAAIGVRRPTTSWALSCSFGGEGSTELLDWLGIPRRHQVSRDSMLDRSETDVAMQGLVLLDCPDHDSTEVSHHIEVDRLVERADLLVWVLDPQKYADAAIHDRYLRPLATHAEIMLVVLNHLDEVPQAGRQAIFADVDRLLDEDGLKSVSVVATSTKTGEGIDDLRNELVKRVKSKKVSNIRRVADIEQVATRMHEQTGDAQPGDVARSSRQELIDAFGDAAGVPLVVDAVHQATSVRAQRATGWPVTAWLSRFRPDPLKRLHLDLGASGRQLTGAARASIPKANEVQRARVDQTVREVVERASEGLPRPWAASVRRGSVSRFDDVGDALDKAVVTTDLGVSRAPIWSRAVQGLQWLIFLGAVAGGLWLLALFGFTYLRLPEPPTPEVRGFAVPTVLVVGGVVVGVLVAMLCRGLAAWFARRKAAAVERRLRSGIADVVDELVIAPIEAELTAYRTARDGLALARR
ncbi:MAG: ABC transporter [Propionibacteriales bacterium]|nr:ABC transporter [Propionibacteriales bacterium]